MKIESKDVLFTDPRDVGYEPEVVRNVIVINGNITLQIDDAGGDCFDWVFREITGEHNGLIEVDMSCCNNSYFTANLGSNGGNVAEILKMSILDFAKLLMDKRRESK